MVKAARFVIEKLLRQIEVVNKVNGERDEARNRFNSVVEQADQASATIRNLRSELAEADAGPMVVFMLAELEETVKLRLELKAERAAAKKVLDSKLSTATSEEASLEAVTRKLRAQDAIIVRNRDEVRLVAGLLPDYSKLQVTRIASDIPERDARALNDFTWRIFGISIT